jgi:hypothetical protein
MFSAKSLVLGGSLLVAVSCLSTASQATNVLSDNFDTENGGVTALQYTNFTNFTVTGTGVDLVHTPDYGITCAGGSGSCVDLDGSPGPGGLQSKLFYSFNAGDVVTLSLDVSGAQRGNPGNDTFQAGFNFGSATDLSNITWNGGKFGSLTGSGGVVGGATTSGNSFSTYVFSFTADTAGTGQIVISTFESGSEGPLLDNVSLDIGGGGVPEPETWAMLVLGVFGIGAMLRLARQKAEISAQPV